MTVKMGSHDITSHLSVTTMCSNNFIYSGITYAVFFLYLYVFHFSCYKLLMEFIPRIGEKSLSLCIKLSIEHSTMCDSRTKLNYKLVNNISVV